MEVFKDEKKNILFTALILLNKPGVLRRVAEIFARHNVNILSGIHYGPADKKESIWVFSADFTHADAAPEVIFKEIEKLDIVYSVKYGVKRLAKYYFLPFG